MKVLVTGNQGYIGHALIDELLREKFEIVGVDLGFFPNDFSENYRGNEKIEQIKKDIRDLKKDDLRGFDAILHLAALSNDPSADLNPKWTEDINYRATVRLAELAKEVGVERFVFSSTCSVYGAQGNKLLTEESECHPISTYAVSKLKAERDLVKLSNQRFAPIILRSATAFGVSPRMRFDLVVNNLTASGYTTGKILLLSDGTAWRPNVHIKDISNAFVAVLKAPFAEVNGEIFNVGMKSENYGVKDIAKIVAEVIPNTEIEFVKNASKDIRSYSVDFSKIQSLKNFKPGVTVKMGVKEIYDTFKSKNFKREDFTDKKYHNVKFMKDLIENKRLDENLKPTAISI